MHFSQVLVVSFAAVAYASANLPSHYAIRSMSSIYKRQGESFRPGTDTCGRGATCAEACGPGASSCGSTCIFIGKGDTCCPAKGSTGPWGCPAKSFCLIDGLCCPDGLDAQTCAKNNGVTLPPDFGKPVTDSPAKPPTTEPVPPPAEQPPKSPPAGCKPAYGYKARRSTPAAH